ncbi:hypothetical protein Ciccas_006647 [Cichlidogyrus casuarinus]|uniref:Uncharacterized protein n=1 Tax=Cichlidogyrus casuarinus TaxID=1844966 RepID=A0ABD2Q5R4_9PLAT
MDTDIYRALISDLQLNLIIESSSKIQYQDVILIASCLLGNHLRSTFLDPFMQASVLLADLAEALNQDLSHLQACLLINEDAQALRQMIFLLYELDCKQHEKNESDKSLSSFASLERIRASAVATPQPLHSSSYLMNPKTIQTSTESGFHSVKLKMNEPFGTLTDDDLASDILMSESKTLFADSETSSVDIVSSNNVEECIDNMNEVVHKLINSVVKNTHQISELASLQHELLRFKSGQRTHFCRHCRRKL